MTIQGMHYDFKQKLNKIDSQKYRNLIIPEIDWKLNEAQEVFVKSVASPRYRNALGLETSQRTIDDIRTIIIEKHEVTPTVFDPKSVAVALPDNYWFLMSSRALASKGTCSNIVLLPHFKQHDDEAEESSFDQSSFEWRETNYRFYSAGIRYFTDGTFSINKVYLDYIKRPAYMHYANGYLNNNYNSPSGENLIGTQSCELPEGSHREIVDLAVLIATGDLQMPDYQVKMAKVKLND